MPELLPNSATPEVSSAEGSTLPPDTDSAPLPPHVAMLAIGMPSDTPSTASTNR